jgi:hypothetical protein
MHTTNKDTKKVRIKTYKFGPKIIFLAKKFLLLNFSR